MIKNVLLAVQERLATIPELKYISEDWGQLDYYDKPPTLWPCALIDCDTISYTDHSQGRQSAVATFNVRVADLRLFDTSMKSPRSAQAYDMFELIQRIYVALQGLKGETFAPITQKSIVKTKRDDAVREFSMTWQVEFYDNTAAVRDVRLEVAVI